MLAASVVLGLACLAGCAHKPTPQEQLSMMFDPNDADNRRQGIELLSQHGWGQKEPYLKGYGAMASSDTDPAVRAAAVRAIGRAGDPQYAPSLIAALGDQNANVRWDAAVALAELTDFAAIEPLARHALVDESVDVRAACAQTLGEYRRRDAAIALIQCLQDKSLAVRYRAAGSLKRLTHQDHGMNHDAWAGANLSKLPPAPDQPQFAPAE